jgi:SMP-30/Gluconolactonase/LRE-like region
VKTVLNSFLVTLLACSALAGEATFASKPAVSKQGAGAKISFAVSAATDVEVAILDANGKVIRHLAAGMVGPDANAPLLKKGLTQSVVWDGKADWKKPAVGGPFNVRVRIGMKPTLERMIGHNPAALGGVRAVAVSPKGELFVFHVSMGIHPSDGSLTGTVFDRSGKYLRTIYPWASNLKAEQLKGGRILKLKDGSRVPFICQAETRSLIPGASEIGQHQAVATSDGRVAFIGHQEWVGTTLRYNQAGIKQLITLNADGSHPEKGVLGPKLARASQAQGSLALSPDEKTIYLTAMCSGRKKKAKGQHAVYKFGWDAKTPDVFVGTPNAPGSGEKGLNNPASVAVDGKGNVYVADQGNNRVVAFKPDGGFLGEIKVEHPGSVAVNRKSGAVYVLCGKSLNQLRKYKSIKDGSPAATAKVPCFKHRRYSAQLHVDASAQPPVVWLTTSSGWAGFKVLRIEDKGGSFGDQDKIEKLSGFKEPAAWGVMGLALDRRNEKLVVGPSVYNLKSGKWAKGLGRKHDTKKGGMGSFGWDGKFYTQSYPRVLRRYGADLKILPFAGMAKGVGKGLGGSVRLRGRGVTSDPAGNVYALWQKKAPGGNNAISGDSNNLCVHSPDGKMTNDKLIDSAIRGLNSPRLDGQGNIYMAIGVRPLGKKVPAAFEGLDLGKIWKYGMNSNDLGWYQLMYGCIVKFSPKGGKIGGGGGTPVEYGILEGKSGGKKTDIQGAEWIYFGASPVPSWRLRFPDVCLCESPRIGLDGWGRSYFPDAARFRCGVLGPGGKEICFFGGYGNLDSAGPKSAVPTPDIPMLWPYTLVTDGDRVYVGDRLNRRILQVKLNFAATATSAIR